MRPTATFYTFMSPGSPAVREYLTSVFGEIAQLYPTLDGIHLDYVRYPGNRELGSFRDFSYDEASVAAFQKIHKKKPLPDMDEWRAFKREQVTETIRAIRNAIRLASPIMRLSATCFAEIHSATAEKGQDPRVWLREDLVDWVTPMAYKRSLGELKTLLDNWNSWFEKRCAGCRSVWKPFNNADESAGNWNTSMRRITAVSSNSPTPPCSSITSPTPRREGPEIGGNRWFRKTPQTVAQAPAASSR